MSVYIDGLYLRPFYDFMVGIKGDSAHSAFFSADFTIEAGASLCCIVR